MASLPSHGLKTESVPSMKPKEKTRPICPPAQSGKSVFCCVWNPFWGERQRRWGGMIMPPSGVQGRQPRHAFGSFRRETKETPGVGRVGPPMGRSAEDGAAPLVHPSSHSPAGRRLLCHQPLIRLGVRDKRAALQGDVPAFQAEVDVQIAWVAQLRVDEVML